MSKPSVNTNPVANGYTEKNERIVEFNSGVPNGPGGLISLRRTEEGKLQVSVYRTDDDVDVIVSRDVDTYQDGVLVNHLVNWWRKLTPDQRRASGVVDPALSDS